MKKVKQRKMLVVIPLLVIPFLTMAFWALGGGKKEKEYSVSTKGLNLDLPQASLKEDRLMDKLGFYDKADRDSLKLDEWMRSDPYFKKDTIPRELEEITHVTATKYNQSLNLSPYEKKGDNPEDQIMKKLKLLEQEMNKPVITETIPKNDDQFSAEIDRLEQMLKINQTSPAEDPEMKQIEGTLEKILDIQHPQRVKDRQKEKLLQNRDAVYAARRSSGKDTIVKGFYGLSDEKEYAEQNAIEAVVHADQVLVNGAVIKFRLASDIYINGQLIPKDNFVYGIATLNKERLEVEISSIRNSTSLFAVKLEIYDLDGLPGIYIPGAITRDVAKESANNSLSLLEMTSLDPSFKAQATATGIGAAKNLLSKKVKLVKVMVKAGYKVLLKDKNQNQ